MSHEVHPKIYLSQDTISNKKDVKNDKTEFGSSYEVFRNGTTAVEVIVKDIKKKHNATPISELNSLTAEVSNLRNNTPKSSRVVSEDTKSMQAEINKLKSELNEASITLNKVRHMFQTIIVGTKKQIDLANQREIEEQTRNVILQLENEKLATLLSSKTKLLNKFKEELTNLKRALKFVIKNINSIPKLSESIDVDCEVIKDKFRRQDKIKLNNIYDGTTTFDSTMSKDVKISLG